jgi:trk system potassium uptake protein TrkH
VSAFCNAGFSLWSDSLIQFQRDAFVQGVHMALIVARRPRLHGARGAVAAPARDRQSQSLQTRIVLMMSLGLVLGGALLFGLTEWDHSLRGLPSTGEKLLNALFQSVSLRTAGFNTVATMTASSARRS